MLNWIVQEHLTWMEGSGFGFVRVLTFPIFQTIAAMLLGMSIVLLAGPSVISRLRGMKIGDQPTFDQADIDKVMSGKQGTPTMGGLLIVGAIVISSLLLMDWSSTSALLAVGALVGFSAIGVLDDWRKLRRKPGEKARPGISSRLKLILQFVVASLLVGSWLITTRADPSSSTLFLAFVKPESGGAVVVGSILTSVLAILVVVGTSNAVNLTDGLDGLAAGLVTLSALVLTIMALIIGDDSVSASLLFHHVEGASQVAVVSAAVAGACLGFLWFNGPPASVFMGDTGSLALGAIIGFVAVVIRQEVIFLLLGAVFVVEALSVMIQVGVFKFYRIRTGTGRRVFLMTPIHHHFQKLGWSETQVVIRFWLIGMVLALLTLSSIKLR